MAHASQLSPEELAKRRAKTARISSMGRVVFSQTCPQTRGGVVVIEGGGYRRDSVTAHFFAPTQFNRSYAQRRMESASAHACLDALAQVSKDLAEKKAAKVAGHDLKVGDVLVKAWGYNMRNVSFFQVVGIPHPRKVDVVAIPHEMVAGDWMAGNVRPQVASNVQDLAGRPRQTLTMSMESGKASARLDSITTVSKWSGKDEMIYSD